MKKGVSIESVDVTLLAEAINMSTASVKLALRGPVSNEGLVGIAAIESVTQALRMFRRTMDLSRRAAILKKWFGLCLTPLEFRHCEKALDLTRGELEESWWLDVRGAYVTSFVRVATDGINGACSLPELDMAKGFIDRFDSHTQFEFSDVVTQMHVAYKWRAWSLAATFDEVWELFQNPGGGGYYEECGDLWSNPFLVKAIRFATPQQAMLIAETVYGETRQVPDYKILQCKLLVKKAASLYKFHEK